MKQKIMTLQLSVDDSGKPVKPKFVEMDNTLEAIQQYIGGNIEAIKINDVIALLHEEGKILGLPLNRIWIDENRVVIDGLVGNILCCRSDNFGNFTSIKESDLEIIEERLIPVYENEVIKWQ